MPTMPIRGANLYVEVLGAGPPILFMHGGPGLDHISLTPFRELADDHTTVFYDHRCNGRSVGPPVESMTWENLTADADALRETLGFERWDVLGHSFGGHVALEYVLRYPDRVSGLILLDTAAEGWWSQENAPRVVAGRGYGWKTVSLTRRFFNGEVEPKDFARAALRLMPVYDSRFSVLHFAREILGGGWRSQPRAEPLIFAGRHLMNGWSVVDRLAEIDVPTLVAAGHDDFLFPPECQAQLAAGIPNARLRIIERAGHNPQAERPTETIRMVRAFLAAEAVAERATGTAVTHAVKARPARRSTRAAAAGRA